jgi:hypothetical protein
MLDRRTSALDVCKVNKFIDHLHEEYVAKEKVPFIASYKRETVKPIRHLSELPEAKHNLIARS